MTHSVQAILGEIQSEVGKHGKSLLLITLVSPSGRTLRRLAYPLNSKNVTESLGDAGLQPDTSSLIQTFLEGRDSTGFFQIRVGEEDSLLILEIVKPTNSLIIFGAGHVGKALAQGGILLGYEVTVIDDREDFLTLEKLPNPDINRIHSTFEQAIKHICIDSNSAIAIVTRGHQYDEICLKAVLRSRARYIGMIGSKRRVLGIMERLQNEGFTAIETSRVYAPIGLKIGAKSPQEIAIAILAQIIQVMNN